MAKVKQGKPQMSAEPVPTFDFKTVTAISSCNGSCQGRKQEGVKGGGEGWGFGLNLANVRSFERDAFGREGDVRLLSDSQNCTKNRINATVATSS